MHDLKVHLTSLNLTVASHTSSIEHLNIQMSALTDKFNQVKAMDVGTHSLAVLTRSGKTIDNGNQATCVDFETQKQDESMAEQVQATPLNTNEPQKEEPEAKQPSPVEVGTDVLRTLPKVHPPFPQRLKKKKRG